MATFEGSVDPATGSLTIHSLRPVGEGETAQAAKVALPPFNDGTPNSGPKNTLELRNATVLNAGAGTCQGTGETSWHADVTLTSFYVNQTLSNVYLELTQVSPAGHEGCNSDPAATGVSATYGLWAFNTMAPAITKTVTLAFRNVVSEAFTFRGRIMAEVGAAVHAAGAPEFDWSPSAIVLPQSKFVQVATTTGQLVWNGTGWDSWVRTSPTTGVTNTIQPQLVGTGGSVSVGLWDPPLAYADLSQGYWQADAAHGGNAIDTTGDFTVCAKVKPQTSPVVYHDIKAFVTKGSLTTEGWGLYQNMGDQSDLLYAFNWILGGTPKPSPVGVTSTPDSYTYDYICGGRASGVTRGNAHGSKDGIPENTNVGTFVDPAALPLTIGAFSDGTYRNHGGVYEVIWDSRPADTSVFHDIVDVAEGRYLFPANAGYKAAYLGVDSAAGIPVVGADGATYAAPAFGTAPLANDGSGLAPVGSVVEYTHPSASSTVSTGYCVGVELAATGLWDDALGGVVAIGSDAGGRSRLEIFAGAPPFIGFASPDVYVPAVPVPVGSWAAGSRHTVMVCVPPYQVGPPNAQVPVFLDGVLAVSGEVQSNAPIDLGAATNTISIGGGAAGVGFTHSPLAGARIGRVFTCPSSASASCN